MCRRADAVFAFTEADHQRLQSWGVSASKVDLVFFLPEPDARELAVWRERFAQRPVALLAGQVRADKRPDVFVEACEMAGVTPAVVGPAGDGEELVRTPGVGVLRVDGYLPLDSFVAAVATCDVVVATHRVGSVSGPLAFARQLGVRSVAPVVGGLAEEVTLVVDRDDAAGFAAAITDVLGAPDPEPRPATRAAQQHLAGYRQLGPFADVVDPVR